MKRIALTALAAAALGLAAGAHAQTLRFASQGDPQTMDPHSQNESFTNSVNQQVYEYLIHRDKQLNFVPGLATSWEQVSPLKWRFKIRQGVKFHDGSAFTADDVVYSINRAKEPTSQSPRNAWPRRPIGRCSSCPTTTRSRARCPARWPSSSRR